MKTRVLRLLTAACCLLPALRSPAATLYVDLNSPEPVAPFTNWATAAANIQDAIDASSSGDLILVTNGVYASGCRVVHGAMSNRVAVTKPVVVQSVNGPSLTVIQGYQVPGTTNGDSAVRCVYLTNGASLVGFTLTNGATRSQGDVNTEQTGGGVCCDSLSATIYHCVLSGNVANDNGGGAYAGILSNCTLVNNSAQYSGGGASGSTLNNCFVFHNVTGTGGGGVVNALLYNCTVVSNSCPGLGGGAEDCTLFNSIIYFNSGKDPVDPFNASNYASCSFNFCCTIPLPDSGAGNINSDPGFAAAPELSSGSPCLGAGNIDYVSGLDIDGQMWATPPPMGCAEYYPVVGPLSDAVQALYVEVETNVSDSFTASVVTGRAVSYRWDFGDGNQASNLLTASHAWAAPGTYPVVFTAFNDSNPAGVSATNSVLVMAATLVHYVSPTSPSPQYPFTNWATAATNIQDAVDASSPQDTVLVSNGVYQTGGRTVSPYLITNRVMANKAISIQSVNGPSATIIEGYSATRCVYLTNGASLTGFTLTNGATMGFPRDVNHEQSGGGVWCEPGSGLVSNCVIVSNTADTYGGGVYGGTLTDCTLDGNVAKTGGGAYGSTLTNCTLTDNSANGSVYLPANGYGGGAYSCNLANCILSSNVAVWWGGGASGGTLVNCLVISNATLGYSPEQTSSGGGGGGAYSATLENCLLMGNSSIAQSTYAPGGGALSCLLNNCTVISNLGAGGGGTAGGTNNNCIIMFNSTEQGPSNNFFCDTVNYCDTSPLPVGGTGNISVNPLLADTFHITSFSPCRGAGSAAYTMGTDLDGEPWRSPPSIGCDEYYGLGPLTVAITAPNTNVVMGFALSFTGGITGSVGSIVWSFGDGGTISNTFTVAHAWQSPGNYTVTVTVYNTTNPGGVSASVGVQVMAQPAHYVSQASTNPVSPYSSWATAATNIQDAVNAASSGDRIWVTNGLYTSGGTLVSGSLLTNRVTVNIPMIIQSWNGPTVTAIYGYQVPGTTNGPGAIRCVYLTNGAVLVGFTLTNGATLTNQNAGQDYVGGGVYSASLGAVVSNCVLSGNSAYQNGGGAYGVTLLNCTVVSNTTTGSYRFGSYGGGGAASCAVSNCTLTGNYSFQTGGGADACTLNDCIFVGNSAPSGGGSAGGVVNNCTFIANTASGGGGGAATGAITNCTFISNTVPTGGGGGFVGSSAPSSGITTGCLFIGNSAGNGGGAYSGNYSSCTFIGNTATTNGGGYYSGSGVTAFEMKYCLFVSNSAFQNGGAIYGSGFSPGQAVMLNCVLSNNAAGIAGGGAYNSFVRNCLFTANSAGQGGGAISCDLYGCALVNNSATLVGGGEYLSFAVNSILVSNIAPVGPNYSNAPSPYLLSYCCTTPLPAVGAYNITNDPLFVDLLNGNFRLQSNSPCINAGNNASLVGTIDLDGNPRISGGTVDIGAYEFQNPASVISYAWLQQYGLATDGSADYADTDHNGMNNWQKWVAGLNPTNAASVLQVLSPVASGTNLAVTWQSVTNVNYFLQRSSSLAPGSFQTIVTNVAGQAGTTSYTDTSAPWPGPWYYRVGVP